MNRINFFCFYYLPVLLWMGLIFYLSSISGLKTGVDSMGLEIFIRKIAHLAEYLILTILVWRVFNKHFYQPENFRKNLLYSMLVVFLYAVSDEFHQYFVKDRAGRFLDVLTDSVGSFLGIVVMIIWSKIKKRQ